MNHAEKLFERLKELTGTSLDAIEAVKTGLEERHHELIYTDLLDDIYGEVVIAGFTYSTGRALKEVDPVAFQVGMDDHLANETIEIDGSRYYADQIETLIEEIEFDMFDRKEA